MCCYIFNFVVLCIDCVVLCIGYVVLCIYCVVICINFDFILSILLLYVLIV